MARTEKKKLEQSFEELLIEVLTQDYDLAVRRDADPIERRMNGTATLMFKYQYVPGTNEAKVIVGVAGTDEFSNVFVIDFSDSEAVERSAEDCEALALYLSEHLQERDEELYHAYEDDALGRREDDLL